MSTHVAETSVAFVAEARKALPTELFVPRPFIYWIDLLVSAAVGWGAFAMAIYLDVASWSHVVAFLIAVFALFRAVTFTHELVHLRRGAVPGFTVGWRLLCGIPLLVPHFLFRGVHVFHHRKTDYGTPSDGEYFPFADRSPRFLFAHIAWVAVLPLLTLVRFTLLGIASASSAKIRRLVERHASSMSLRIKFSRDLPGGAKDVTGQVEEASCVLLATSVVVLTLIGAIRPSVLGHWYALVACIALVNMVRAIGGTHRYRSNESAVSFSDQILDSVNIESRSVATLLLCPVGLRFHALHHMFPTLPYHSLGAAHQRLMESLPAESPYRGCSIPGVGVGFLQVWRESRASSESPLTPSLTEVVRASHGRATGLLP